MWVPGPILVAGPCALDGDAVNLCIAETLARLGARLGVRVVFKGSFDKANRARGAAPRGPGLGPGLEQLARVRAETALPLLTDVHEAWAKIWIKLCGEPTTFISKTVIIGEMLYCKNLEWTQ